MSTKRKLDILPEIVPEPITNQQDAYRAINRAIAYTKSVTTFYEAQRLNDTTKLLSDIAHHLDLTPYNRSRS